MKKLSYYLSFLLLFTAITFISCDDEQLEGEFFSTPDGSDPAVFCSETGLLAIAEAQIALAGLDPSEAQAGCDAFKATINSYIATCGDEGGSLQLLLDELGNDCNVMTDGGGGVTCGNIMNQDAQGTFKGVDFVNQGGSYRLQAGSYFCRILVTEPIGGDCFFPEFGGNEGSILFSLPNLDPQTITFSDVAGEGESLNFNSIDNGVTNVELAVCGELEVLSSTDTTLNGRIVAIGQDGSTINGNFTLTICE